MVEVIGTGKPRAVRCETDSVRVTTQSDRGDESDGSRPPVPRLATGELKISSKELCTSRNGNAPIVWVLRIVAKRGICTYQTVLVIACIREIQITLLP